MAICSSDLCIFYAYYRLIKFEDTSSFLDVALCDLPYVILLKTLHNGNYNPDIEYDGRISAFS